MTKHEPREQVMINENWDTLWINARIVDTALSLGFRDNAAIASKNGKIVFIGDLASIPNEKKTNAQVHDVGGKLLTPGLIDCHTHLVYGGNRANEFAMRLQGASYESIAKAGGGIQSTVQATRELSEEQLFAESLPRAQAALRNGVTTLEIKSGYGLDLPTERKILRVAKRIGEQVGIHVSLTFLGAHALPIEYKNNADGYIDLVVNEMLPSLVEEKLVHNVDVFCEHIAFDVAQTEKVFAAAQQYNLNIKCHAEQLSNMGASKLASRYHACSVDHLEFLSGGDVDVLSESKTVAVLLPGAFYFLREKQMPPVELLRQKKIPIAIATDCNPGTSPIASLLLIMNMACTLFRLTPEEAFLGVTKHAAQALRLGDEIGSLAIGYNADFAEWNVKDAVTLCYEVGVNPLSKLYIRGIESTCKISS